MPDNVIVCLFPACLVCFEKFAKKERKNTRIGKGINKTKQAMVPSYVLSFR